MNELFPPQYRSKPILIISIFTLYFQDYPGDTILSAAKILDDMVTNTLNRSLMNHDEGHRRKWLLPIDGQPPLCSPKTISQCILSLEKTFLVKNYDFKFRLRYRGDLLTRLRG